LWAYIPIGFWSLLRTANTRTTFLLCVFGGGGFLPFGQSIRLQQQYCMSEPQAEKILFDLVDLSPKDRWIFDEEQVRRKRDFLLWKLILPTIVERGRSMASFEILCDAMVRF